MGCSYHTCPLELFHMWYQFCFQLLICAVFQISADHGREDCNFFKHNYLAHVYLTNTLLLQVYFFFHVLLTTYFLCVLLSLGSHMLSKCIHIFRYCYIESVLAGVCLYFAFSCKKKFWSAWRLFEVASFQLWKCKQIEVCFPSKST